MAETKNGENGKWGFGKKALTGIVGLIIVGAIVWLIVGGMGGENKATREILNLPDGEIVAVNEDGSEFSFDVKIGAFDTKLEGVNPEVIRETVIYIASPSPRSFTRVYENIDADIEVAYFDSDKALFEIFQVPANTRGELSPSKEYKYSIIAPQGFFSDNNLSVENGTKLR